MGRKRGVEWRLSTGCRAENERSQRRRAREREARGGDAPETVEGLAGALEGVDDVERGDRLTLGVLGVRDRVADDVLEEDLEDSARLFVDEARDALDTAAASETADRRLGDALDVVAELRVWTVSVHKFRVATMRRAGTRNLAVTLGAALSETLATLSTARHCVADTQRGQSSESGRVGVVVVLEWLG
jgi:enamine deaminase RidA (YjgF/YER057c/UK114 family)